MLLIEWICGGDLVSSIQSIFVWFHYSPKGQWPSNWIRIWLFRVQKSSHFSKHCVCKHTITDFTIVTSVTSRICYNKIYGKKSSFKEEIKGEECMVVSLMMKIPTENTWKTAIMFCLGRRDGMIMVELIPYPRIYISEVCLGDQGWLFDVEE